MRNTADLIIESARDYYSQVKSDPNGRDRSWEHCYKCFHDARRTVNADYDYLSLQLAFYLASWGMYRGSAFLTQKDYKVHIPIVEEVLKGKYDCLFGIECIELRTNDIRNCLGEIESFMVNYYEGIRKQVKNEVKNGISTTLITKILLGVFGCVPAYDRCFIEGVRKHRITTMNYSINSLLKLVDFYEDNRSKFEKVRRNFRVYDLLYPQMKLLDMGLWQIGFRELSRKK